MGTVNRVPSLTRGLRVRGRRLARTDCCRPVHSTHRGAPVRVRLGSTSFRYTLPVCLRWHRDLGTVRTRGRDPFLGVRKRFRPLSLEGSALVSRSKEVSHPRGLPGVSGPNVRPGPGPSRTTVRRMHLGRRKCEPFSCRWSQTHTPSVLLEVRLVCSIFF